MCLIEGFEFTRLFRTIRAALSLFFVSLHSIHKKKSFLATGGHTTPGLVSNCVFQYLGVLETATRERNQLPWWIRDDPRFLASFASMRMLLRVESHIPTHFKHQAQFVKKDKS
jgi:hypothetical protein